MNSIPVLPVKNSVIFPGSAVPLRVGRAQSVAAIEAARKNGLVVLAVAQKTPVDDRSGEARVNFESDLHSVGTFAKIEKIRGTAETGFQIVLRGVSRHRALEFAERAGAIFADAEELRDGDDSDPATLKALLDSVRSLARDVLELLPGDTRHLSEVLAGVDDLSFLGYLVAANLDLDPAKKQALLEIRGLRDRSLALLGHLQKLRGELEVRGEIRDKLSSKLGKMQRETILREQLKAIREELGDEPGGKDAESDYRKKIEDAGLSDEARKIALDELKRLEAMGGQSAESHVIRNYLDLLVSLPWSKSSANSDFANLDVENARKILNDDHYGLEKIKSRILQHLAVMKLKKSNRGQILLFVGPPGVGKTSLGESVARALGRKFVRGSLGGVRDDAEIRGHRRTYVGAMPGRIVQALKRAGENDAVFLLDEIDKLGRGYSGDPAGALLEVLDPEQNATFTDHYLDVPFDLSKVFFIATANSLDAIPGPLLDRMEVIELSGYTTAEKLHIAKNHLIPKQRAEHGMESGQLAISDEALLRIIHAYTREAGVRDLQRKLASVCRAMAEKVAARSTAGDSSNGPLRVELADLEDILGPERHVHEVAERLNPPGVTTGLAWTPVGGEILFIEANRMPGKGNLIVTGQLGDVMKESTQIALSLVRSRLAHAIPEFEFARNDLHVHVPAGAIPKDGPSAGITMLTTIASLLTGRSVDSKLAMTGEITLRGAVMPVGGIKEKVIAAHRAGIERVILSKRNEKDLRDVPEDVKAAMRFDFVENAGEVLKLALGLEAVAAPTGGAEGPATSRAATA